MCHGEKVSACQHLLTRSNYINFVVAGLHLHSPDEIIMHLLDRQRSKTKIMSKSTFSLLSGSYNQQLENVKVLLVFTLPSLALLEPHHSRQKEQSGSDSHGTYAIRQVFAVSLCIYLLS